MFDDTFDDTFEETVFLPPDFTTSETVTAGSIFTIPGDIEVLGVKYERFTPFVTIRDRVQIGITYGAGIGSLSGTVIEQRFEAFDPDTGEPTETIIERDIKEFYALDFVPFGSVEAAVAFVLAPGLKARVTGGFNYPKHPGLLLYGQLLVRSLAMRRPARATAGRRLSRRRPGVRAASVGAGRQQMSRSILPRPEACSRGGRAEPRERPRAGEPRRHHGRDVEAS